MLFRSREREAIRAGSFAAGSSIRIICINGADLQSKGGKGGSGGGAIYDNEVGWTTSKGTSPQAGGTVYSADGIDTSIYLSGSIDTYTADGYIRAAGGGGAGTAANINSISDYGGGNGGGGGAGVDVGAGGAGGDAVVVGIDITGGSGNAGTETGTGGAGNSSVYNPVPSMAGGDWGQAGGSNSYHTGGAAGKGIVKNGATVTIFGGNASRFINGNGDTPD